MIQTVLGSLMKRPATTRYPFEPSPMPERFRGKLAFHGELCINCRICMRDCPSDAIVITKIGDTEIQAEIDLARCIYCAQCVDSCPKKALEATGDFELAQLTRDRLKMVFRVKQEPKAPKKSADPAPAAQDGPKPGD
jgi:formate hydrogenlyase subunit 6/NADH:ubiquinone oxidoreductase subunit I